MDFVQLNNGIQMPQLGFGVYQISNEQITDVMPHAFNAGYRSIDTAQFYANEQGLGIAIKESGLSREELFITTKVWNSHQGYDNTLRAFEESMEKLALDYLDLYLVHWPAPDFNKYVETYQALEKLYNDGRVRAIGVCNFDIEHLEQLFSKCVVKPAVNQVECHPYFQQQEMKAFCKEHGIFVEAWSPLYRGEGVFAEETIQRLAKKHKKTPAQIILRWHLQEGVIVIPKSATPSRINENIDIFDFELAEEDMKLMAGLDRNQRRGAVPKEMHLI